MGKLITQEKRPSLFINALSNWVALATVVFVGFFLTPYIINNLGKTGYGIWVLISSIIGYYGILELGVTSAITRYVARYAGQKDFRSLNETISTAFILFCFVGLFVVVMSFVVADPLARFFKVQSDQAEEFRHVVWLLGLGAGLGFSSNLFGSVIRAHELFVVANAVTIIITLIRAILIVLFLSYGFGLKGIAFSHVITATLMIILYFTMCKKLFSHFKIRARMANLNILKVLLAFGASTTILQVADIMRFNLDSFVIGKWIGLPAVGVYGVAALLIRYMLQFVATGTQAVFTPRFATLDGEGKREEFKQLFFKSLSIASFISFGVGILIIVIGWQFIILWVGQDFIDAAPVLSILAIAYSVALAQNPGISAMYALKKHHFFAVASIIEGITNVALSIYLAPRYGIIGVAIGTAAPMLVTKLFVQPIYVARIMRISLMRYWGQLAPAFILAIGVVSIRYDTLQTTSLSNGYVSLAVSAIPYILAFLLLYVLVHKFTKKMHFQKRVS